eukprot:1582936-Pleurochrysis_carterae.AAC.1
MSQFWPSSPSRCRWNVEMQAGLASNKAFWPLVRNHGGRHHVEAVAGRALARLPKTGGTWT